MALITKAQLIDQLAAERHNNELLRAELARLSASHDVLDVQLAEARRTAAQRPATRPVYEFNAAVKGDFMRAAALAKANNGIVRRAA